MDADESGPERPLLAQIFFLVSLQAPQAVVFEALALVLLLVMSAFISGSEVAFFSIDKKEVRDFSLSNQPVLRIIARLLQQPRHLLATILISNNLINIAIVILSTQLLDQLMTFDQAWAAFTVNVVLTTFMLVLFGEVIPKVYANRYNVAFASRIARPMWLLSRLLYPFSAPLAGSTGLIESRFQGAKSSVTVDELEQALELTENENTSDEEKNILRGVINFSQLNVKQVMTSRIDVVGFEINASWDEVLHEVNENRYSRLPVFHESFDQIRGLLYIKDLVPYLGQPNPSVTWQEMLREPYYVPESKKIDDLLKEFQEKKVHMAIVVDEYGGSSGIITLEDILEEIVGEINDEFDKEEINFQQLDDDTYIFDAKTPLKEVGRAMGLDMEIFQDIQGDVESVGGLAVEICGRIPIVGKQLVFDDTLSLVIEARDRKKVKRVRVKKLKREPSER